MGQGLIGLLVTGYCGFGVRVLAVDLEESRRPLCLAMGAERVVPSGRRI
jgi:threonine dehydrogenase-like Zn-dependent dehydrogenase